MWKRLFSFVLGMQLIFGASPVQASFIDRELLEKAKPFLELIRFFVVNRAPRIDCRVDHPVLGNLIVNDKSVELALGERLGDIRFLPTAYHSRGFLLSIGVDPDFPEPLEIYPCSGYEMLKRYVDGETVNIIRENTERQYLRMNDHKILLDMVVLPLSELQVNYYIVDGEREYFFDKQGKIVFPYYLPYDETWSLPAHLLGLKLKNPDAEIKEESITLAQFFDLMRKQDENTSHELWNRRQLPQNNILRVYSPLDYNTAPEYQKVRAIFEEVRDFVDEMLKELQKQR